MDKLTKAQRRELVILKEYNHITTEGRGVRFNVLMRLYGKGLAVRDAKYGCIFSLTESGKNHKIFNG